VIEKKELFYLCIKEYLMPVISMFYGLIVAPASSNSTKWRISKIALPNCMDSAPSGSIPDHLQLVPWFHRPGQNGIAKHE